MTSSQPDMVCLTSSLETEDQAPRERQERWKVFAPLIVAEKIKGFDWLGYRACMDTIISIPKILHVDAEVRQLHSRFARILLAFVQLAEADLPTARATWRASAPSFIGMPTFLEENLS